MKHLNDNKVPRAEFSFRPDLPGWPVYTRRPALLQLLIDRLQSTPSWLTFETIVETHGNDKVSTHYF